MLPFFVVALVPLLLLIGLLIDTSLTSTSQYQMRTQAQAAALGGLSKFLSEYTNYSRLASCSSNASFPWQRLAECAAGEAVTRASQIAQANLFAGEPFVTGGQANDLGERQGATLQRGTHGWVETGKYLWRGCNGLPEGENCPSPCDSDPSKTCFVPTTPSEVDLNALRVTLALDQSPLKTFFMKLAGATHTRPVASAVATVVPFNYVFLIDLSRSMYRDNYLAFGVLRPDPGEGIDPIAPGCSRADYEGPGKFSSTRARTCWLRGTASDFAFKVNEANPLPDATCGVQPTEVVLYTAGGEQAFCEPDGDPCPIYRFDGAPGDHFDWGVLWQSGSGLVATHLCDNPDDPSCVWPEGADVADRRFLRYREHYRCRAIELSPGEWVKYLIDYQVPSGVPITKAAHPFKDAPEPLGSVLNAVATGMRALRNRAIALDKFGLMGFDDQIPPATVYARRRHLLGPVNTIEFNRLLQAVDIDNYSNTYTWQFDFPAYGLFPFPERFTDIQLSLIHALNQIAGGDNYPANPTYRIARNVVTLFSDGLSNCPWTVDASGNDVPVVDENGNRLCANTGSMIRESLNALRTTNIVSQLQERKVSVNVVLIGRNVGAHYLARKASLGGRCMDQIEAQKVEREGDTNPAVYVDAGFDSPDNLTPEQRSYHNLTDEQIDELYQRSRDEPFYLPNELYETLVVPTKGLFIPILPKCTTAGGEDLVFLDELNAACADQDDSDPIVRNWGPANAPFNVVDGRGRILCHPLAWSAAEQLDYWIRETVQASYVLVEPQIE